MLAWATSGARPARTWGATSSSPALPLAMLEGGERWNTRTVERLAMRSTKPGRKRKQGVSSKMNATCWLEITSSFSERADEFLEVFLRQPRGNPGAGNSGGFDVPAGPEW